MAAMAGPLHRLWQSIQFQEPSAHRVLSFDPMVLNQLHPNEFWILLQMYSQLVQQACMLGMDCEENVVRLGTIEYLIQFDPVVTAGYMVPEFQLPFVLPPAQAAARAQNAVPTHIVGPNKVPRPRNAFIIYRMNKSRAVRAANPTLHNNRISVIIGKMWQDETSDVRTAYKKLADEEKKHHLKLYPNYRYQPRKPSEKKRRMTKNKADAMASQQSITAHLNNANGDGYLQGASGEVRNTALPLSANAEACIVTDNNNMLDAPKATGFDFTPSEEYAAAQAVDIAMIGDHMGVQFSFNDPSPSGVDGLGKVAQSFDFVLHSNEYPGYEGGMASYL